jgi:deazaflavin-dependent oxidoreductase (nitroreductase family)
MARGTTNTPAPSGLKRWLLRLPIWLYRFGLGGLLGGRFVMLTHIGRKSGLPRQVVLEVVNHDAATDTYFIASGWGEKADWLRNIERTPHVLLDAGRRRFEATATRLSQAEAAEQFGLYARRHPAAIRSLARVMLGQPFTGSAEDCHRLAQFVPVVALRRR